VLSHCETTNDIIVKKDSQRQIFNKNLNSLFIVLQNDFFRKKSSKSKTRRVCIVVLNLHINEIKE
jgi:hypothetical protein